MKPSRKHLAVIAVAASSVIGTAGIAAAAGFPGATSTSEVAPSQDNGTSTDSGINTTAPADPGTDTNTDAPTDPAPTDRPARVQEEELTGDSAALVTAAAEKAVPGGTVDRVEADTNDGGAYEAHVTDADGNRVKVIFDADLNVVEIKTGGPGGPGGPGGQRPDETPLEGDVAAQVTAAAEAAVPGGTVDRVETDADSDAAYEAHVTDADGNRITVTFDESYNLLETLTGGPGGPGGPGGRGDQAPPADAPADSGATSSSTTG